MPNINDYGLPLTSQDGDRKYSALEWREYFSRLIHNGLIQNAANECQVKPQAVPNKTVYVDTGVVFINGAMRVLDAPITLAVAENTSGNPRIDRVVARLNEASRTIEFAVKQGTPAGSPVAPTLTRTEGVYELGLADITLINGYSTITSGVISELRINEDICGYSKTMYMQTFDDENNLLKYNRDVVSQDASGNPTDIRYKRSDSTLFLKRLYTNPDANGRYQTITEEFYIANGTTKYKTIVYSLTYFTNGIIDTMTRVVS